MTKRRYFEELAMAWDQLPRPPDELERACRFVTKALGRPARYVLDAGCGTGILAPALLELGQGARIVELDFAWAMLAVNRSKPGHARLLHVCADALLLPFAPGSFDLVLCFGLLPHLGDARRALATLLEVVRPGGALAVGHVMGSQQLNAFHAQLEGPVNQDRLPGSAELAGILRDLGAVVECAEEAPDWYFVRCVKRPARAGSVRR
ncbi:MAG: class I SAM-dependent methyltransferase [Bryobacteraceae bacterium]